jgi:cyclase
MTGDVGESAPERAQLIAVRDGVHAWVQPDGSWWINNAGAVHGDDGVILIDTCATRRRTQRLLSAVEAATGSAPIRLAVNTHMHGDHTYGNALLPDSTVIVGHERTRDGLLADTLRTNTPPVWLPTPDWGIDRTRPPSLVFRDEVTLFTGQRRVELRHPGYSAHTAGDVVAWLPDERVLFAGDLLFHQVTPMMYMGSLDGALRSLDWLATFNPVDIVPGHGPLLPAGTFSDVLAAHARYYHFVRAAGRRGRAEGLTPLQTAQQCDLGEFAAWPDQERLVLNLHRDYADATGTATDLKAAIMDALTFNGGPMHCAV